MYLIKLNVDLDKESRMDYGLHSKNTYIMDEPECVDLKKFVLDLTKGLCSKHSNV